MWTCSACNGANPAETRFCGHCGAAADAPWSCAACGNENPAGTKFCGQCGTPAAAAPAAAPSPTTTADQDVAEALKSFVAGPVAARLMEAGGKLPDERRLITSLADMKFAGYCFAEIPESADAVRVLKYFRGMFRAYQGL